MAIDLDRDLEALRRALDAKLGDDLVTLALFGSRAQGRARPESDADLLLVARGLPRRRFDRQALVRPLVRDLGEDFATAVSFVYLTPEEARDVKPFYLGFLDGHRLIVDRDGFFRGVLDRLRARLEELGSRRLFDELGNPYWDLKPDFQLGDDVVL